MTESTRALNVAVIGAGAAGLVAARELQREGHSVQVYETSPSLGGIWNYQEEIEDDLLGRDPHRHIVHSSLYASLRVNLPREIMSYSDFPFIPEAMAGRSRDARRFPHHTEVLAYLEAFADQFNLRSLIRFNTRVVRLEQSTQPHIYTEHEQNSSCSGQTKEHGLQRGQAGWRVISEPAGTTGRQEGNAKQTEETFEAVVVATGYYHEPNLPDIAGMDTFPGLQMHCHNFRHNERFRDQRVLVVGASYSGIELANHVAEVAQRVFHSARTWGSSDYTEQAKPNLERVPMLTHLSPDASASFCDGRSISNIDSVIYCTGYLYKYPFLEHLNLISTDEMHVHPLYKHIFVPSVAPTLAFVGLLWKSLRNIQFETQARWVAQVLSGKAMLPGEAAMMDDIRSFYALRAEHGVPIRYTHCQTTGMPVTQWEYNEDLRRRCHPPPPPAEQWRVELHEQSAGKILGEPSTFRDTVTPEDKAYFGRARAACLQMWQQLEAPDSSHSDGPGLRASDAYPGSVTN